MGMLDGILKFVKKLVDAVSDVVNQQMNKVQNEVLNAMMSMIGGGFDEIWRGEDLINLKRRLRTRRLPKPAASSVFWARSLVVWAKLETLSKARTQKQHKSSATSPANFLKYNHYQGDKERWQKNVIWTPPKCGQWDKRLRPCPVS